MMRGRPLGSAVLVVAGLLLGIGLSGACRAPEVSHLCSAEVVGEDADWERGTLAEVSECTDEPRAMMGLCVRPPGDGAERPLEFEVDAPGVITEVGEGTLPEDCHEGVDLGFDIDEIGNLIAPPETLRWIRVRVEGQSWLIVMAASNNRSVLEVGDDVWLWVDWSSKWTYEVRFELRDVAGDPVWWLFNDGGGDVVDSTPGCIPLRMGAAVCNGDDYYCSGIAQRHAVEIDGVSVSPGEQAVIDGMRFTNAANELHFDSGCSDPSYGWRLFGATRE